jgi:hypothetical protein
MLEAVSLGRLRNYEMVIVKLTRTYPTEWRLVYAADELACSARSNRFRAKVLMDTKAGKKTSANWDAKRSWNYVFTMISLADTFLHTQVHAPALTWPWVTEGNLNPRV